MVGPRRSVRRARGTSRRDPWRARSSERVVPGRGPWAAREPPEGSGHGRGRPRVRDGTERYGPVPLRAIAHRYQPRSGGRSPAGSVSGLRQVCAAPRPSRARRPPCQVGVASRRPVGRRRRGRRRPRDPSRGRPGSRRRPPTRAARSASAWHRAKTGSGLGLHREAVVAADHRPDRGPRRRGRGASRRSGRGRRWSRPRSAGRRRGVARTGPAGRPAGLASATGSGTNQAVSVARRAAADARAPASQHRRHGPLDARPSCAVASGPPAATRPVDGSKPIAANTSGATGRRAAASRRVPSSRAQPPHIAWKSMSVPSLSKTTRSMPGEVRRRSAPRLQQRLRGRQRGRSGPGPRRARGRGRPPAGTRGRSGSRPAGTARFGLLNVSTSTGDRVGADRRAHADDRAEERDVGDGPGTRLAPVTPSIGLTARRSIRPGSRARSSRVASATMTAARRSRSAWTSCGSRGRPATGGRPRRRRSSRRPR